MWKEKLKEVEAEMRTYGLAPPPGVEDESLAAWRRAVEERCGAAPPPEYLEVLRQVNGLQWNGSILYGADRAFLPPEKQGPAGKGQGYGLLERNELWRETDPEGRYLFLGESGISWYVMETSTGRFLLLDSPSGREVETFSDCHQLLETLLAESLT